MRLVEYIDDLRVFPGRKPVQRVEHVAGCCVVSVAKSGGENEYHDGESVIALSQKSAKEK